MFQRIRNIVSEAFRCTTGPRESPRASRTNERRVNVREMSLSSAAPQTTVSGEAFSRTTNHPASQTGETSGGANNHARARTSGEQATMPSAARNRGSARRSPSPPAQTRGRTTAQQTATSSSASPSANRGHGDKARRDESPPSQRQVRQGHSPHHQDHAGSGAVASKVTTTVTTKVTTTTASTNSSSSRGARAEAAVVTTAGPGKTGHAGRPQRLGEVLARGEASGLVMKEKADRPAIEEKKYYWPPGVGKKNLNGVAMLPGSRSASAKAYCRHLVTAAAHWRLTHAGEEFDFQKHFRDQATIGQSLPQDIDGLYAHMRRNAPHTHYLSMEQFGAVIDELRSELTSDKPEHVTFLRLGGHALMLSIREDRIALFDPDDTHRETRINLIPGQPSDVKLQDLLTAEQLGKYFKRIPGIMIHLLQPAAPDYVAQEKAYRKEGAVAQHDVTFHCELSAPLLRALLYDAHHIYTALTDLPFRDMLTGLAASEGGVDKLRDILAADFDDVGLVKKNWHPYLKSFVQGAEDGSHALVDILSYMVGANMAKYEWRPCLAEQKEAVLQANLPAAWKLDELDVTSMMRGNARDAFLRLMGLFAEQAPQQLSDTLCARVVAELVVQLSRQVETAEKLDVHQALNPERKRNRHHERLDEAFFPFTLQASRASQPTLDGLFHFIADALQRPPLNDEHARHLETLARVTFRGLQIQFDPDREKQYRQYVKLQRLRASPFSNAKQFPENALKAAIGPLEKALPENAAEVRVLVERRWRITCAFD